MFAKNATRTLMDRPTVRIRTVISSDLHVARLVLLTSRSGPPLVFRRFRPPWFFQESQILAQTSLDLPTRRKR